MALASKISCWHSAILNSTKIKQQHQTRVTNFKQ
jgi:hypothetical protein